MKKMIIIADDSVKLLEGLKIQLEHHGFDVATCTDAYMALALSQKCKPDLMILDIHMPAGNGFSVQERMQKLPDLNNIPTIYISGDASFKSDRQAEAIGAWALIRKPIPMPLLLRTIESALRDRESSPTSPEERKPIFQISPDIDPSTVPGVQA